MTDNSVPGPEEGVRRFLTDLRSGGERRTGTDRRRTSRPGAHDRRSGADRRRPLGTQFSIADGLLIREMVLHPGFQAACPQCDGNLLLGPLETHDDTRMQDVHCTQCRRHALLADL